MQLKQQVRYRYCITRCIHSGPCSSSGLPVLSSIRNCSAHAVPVQCRGSCSYRTHSQTRGYFTSRCCCKCRKPPTAGKRCFRIHKQFVQWIHNWWKAVNLPTQLMCSLYLLALNIRHHYSGFGILHCNSSHLETAAQYGWAGCRCFIAGSE